MEELFQTLGSSAWISGLVATVAILGFIMAFFRNTFRAARWSLRFRKHSRDRAQRDLQRAQKDAHFLLAYGLSQGLFSIGLLAYGAGLMVYARYLLSSTPGLAAQWGGMLSALVGILVLGLGFWGLFAVSDFAWKVLDAKRGENALEDSEIQS